MEAIGRAGGRTNNIENTIMQCNNDDEVLAAKVHSPTDVGIAKWRERRRSGGRINASVTHETFNDRGRRARADLPTYLHKDFVGRTMF